MNKKMKQGNGYPGRGLIDEAKLQPSVQDHDKLIITIISSSPQEGKKAPLPMSFCISILRPTSPFFSHSHKSAHDDDDDDDDLGTKREAKKGKELDR